MFWNIMSPNGGGEPTGAITSAINKTFGSFAAFKQQFNDVGDKRFGSGWAWLVRTKDGKLQVTEKGLGALLLGIREIKKNISTCGRRAFTHKGMEQAMN